MTDNRVRRSQLRLCKFAAAAIKSYQLSGLNHNVINLDYDEGQFAYRRDDFVDVLALGKVPPLFSHKSTDDSTF